MKIISKSLKETEKVAKEFLALGFSLSFTGVVTYPKSKKIGMADYEEIIKSNFHTFTTTSKALKVKFILNSTDNLTPPLI